MLMIRLLTIHQLLWRLSNKKHPEPHIDTCIGPAPDDSLFSFTINEQDVRTNGSAGGPDGLHPQHLKDLTGFSAKEGGQSLLKALKSLIMLILSGKTHITIRPPFLWCYFGCPAEERWRNSSDSSGL